MNTAQAQLAALAVALAETAERATAVRDRLRSAPDSATRRIAARYGSGVITRLDKVLEGLDAPIAAGATPSGAVTGPAPVDGHRTGPGDVDGHREDVAEGGRAVLARARQQIRSTGPPAPAHDVQRQGQEQEQEVLPAELDDLAGALDAAAQRSRAAEATIRTAIQAEIQARAGTAQEAGSDDGAAEIAGLVVAEHLDDLGAGLLALAAADTREATERLRWIRRRSDCPRDHGVCPEHGATLWRPRLGGVTVCRSCSRTWEEDRAGLPCTEPVAVRVEIAPHHPGDHGIHSGHGDGWPGTTERLCLGHARAAQRDPHRRAAITITPL